MRLPLPEPEYTVEQSSNLFGIPSTDVQLYASIFMLIATLLLVVATWRYTHTAKLQFKASQRPYLHIHNLLISHTTIDFYKLTVTYSNECTIPVETRGCLIIKDGKKLEPNINIAILLPEGQGTFGFSFRKQDNVDRIVFEARIYYRSVFEKGFVKTVKVSEYLLEQKQFRWIENYSNNAKLPDTLRRKSIASG